MDSILSIPISFLTRKISLLTVSILLSRSLNLVSTQEGSLWDMHNR
ncbi:hypothetical protein bhYOR_001350 (plasmid) [Borrelia nietonii YOR]|nr:hypothetical protein bhYOR_001350 [Borrelia nietonii YOR]